MLVLPLVAEGTSDKRAPSRYLVMLFAPRSGRWQPCKTCHVREVEAAQLRAVATVGCKVENDAVTAPNSLVMKTRQSYGPLDHEVSFCVSSSVPPRIVAISNAALTSEDPPSPYPVSPSHTFDPRVPR